MPEPAELPKDYQPSQTSQHELFQVDVAEFAGPLDLLLFLIRRHELDVFDIPISFIIERYLEMLDRMQALPIDVAAEFLVMAAELAHIKSKMLLPPKEGVPVDAEEDVLGDPRSDLVHRLLEYQKYRDMAGDLGDRDRLGRDIFARSPGTLDPVDDFDPGFRDVSLFRLVESMSDVLARLEPEVQHQVEAAGISISDRVRSILCFGEEHGMRFTFAQLLEGVESRRVVVVTFIALLEMARSGLMHLAQSAEEPEPEGQFQIVLTGKPTPPDLLGEEAD